MNGRVFGRITAIALAFVLFATATVSAQATGTTELTIRARGTTGVEIMQVRDAGALIAEFTLSTQWDEIELSVRDATEFDNLAVGFVNNQHEPVDRNVFVDWVQLGAERRQAESGDVWSTGKWTSQTGCTNGPASTQTIHCAGFLHFGGEPSGSVIEAYGVGSTGTENLELHIDGTAVATRRVSSSGNVWSGNTTTTPVRFTLPNTVDHGRIRVAFANDDDFQGVDRNVRIDRIDVDGTSYETNDPRIESVGTWATGARCGRGSFETPTLVCNGWFQLPPGEAATKPPPVGNEPPPEEPPITQPGPPASLELSVDVAASGLTNPWGMDFLPTGELLFAERIGRLNVLSDSGVSEIAADFNNLGSGTSGLLGLAVDADFESNGRFYTCQGQESPGRQQIVAWQLSADLSTATKVDLLVDLERSDSHSGCRLQTDDDGYLWATLGDDQVATAPQDVNSLHGKILRIDPATGQGHPDNLNSGPERDARIYSLGHRNPQGLSFHPDTGQAWIFDHGPDLEDEINALQVGGNYGWNPVGANGEYDEIGRTMTDPNVPDAIEAVWNSGASTIAPGDIAFLDGERWGDFDGAIAMTTLKDQRLHLVRLDGDGQFIDLSTPSELDQSTHKRLRTAMIGPDGALWLSTSNSGSGDDDLRVDSILRLTPAGYFPANPGSSTITVTARGSTGTEQLHLDIAGTEVHSWTPGTSDGETTYVHPVGVSGSQVRVRFSNDGLDDGRDRNVWIDNVTINGELFESEDPSVRSRGAWANGARCREGLFNTEFLACNGWFQYAGDGVPSPPTDPSPGPDPEPVGTRLEVRALGTTGEELLELRIRGELIETFELSTVMTSYIHDFTGSIGENDIRLAFANDGRSTSGADRNARVDFLRVDGDTYQTESPTVLSTGTYSSATRCAAGNKQSEWLHCTGYLQYSISPVL